MFTIEVEGGRLRSLGGMAEVGTLSIHNTAPSGGTIRQVKLTPFALGIKTLLKENGRQL